MLPAAFTRTPAPSISEPEIVIPRGPIVSSTSMVLDALLIDHFRASIWQVRRAGLGRQFQFETRESCRWRPPCYALAAMQERPTPPHRTSSAWRRRLIVTGIIVGFGSLVWSRLPKGSYPTDLSRIGQGQAVLVLAMDSNYLAGASVMNLLNDVRHEFANSVQFLVASMALPDGQAFANQHQASDGTVVLFDANGQRVAVLYTPQTQDELRQALQKAFGL